MGCDIKDEREEKGTKERYNVTMIIITIIIHKYDFRGQCHYRLQWVISIFGVKVKDPPKQRTLGWEI